MWDDMRIQFSSALEIAQGLIDNEVTLSQLRSVAAFAAKADLTEDAVWNTCEATGNYQRYLEIYPNGKNKAKVEEYIWRNAIERNDMNSFMAYKNNYPQGTHVMEVDDKVWEVAKANGSVPAYLHFFPTGNHVEEARSILAARQAEEDAWLDAKSIDTAESYRGYTEKYSRGIHIAEANQRIAELMAGRKKSIVDDLSEDRNAYRLQYLKTALRFTKDDLRGRIKDSNGQIRDDVLKSWDKEQKNLNMGMSPTSIPKGSTEVYFWGVPGSGKTCAMAAILSCARKMGCYVPRTGPGLGYMNQLSTMFISDDNAPAVCLPPATDIGTQYLPLSLNEVIEGRNGKQVIKRHNLSVIEISGEIFECFSCELENRPFRSNEHKETYEKLKLYLQNRDNPKYHFFILDSRPMRNTDQMLFLQNAALYFTDSGIFNSTTQGISLIVTKSDVLSPDRNQWVTCAQNAALTNFPSLVMQLKSIVGDPREGGLGISDGSLDVIPLSIGEVFFQSLCLFDPEPAKVVVKKLIEYSKVAETDDWKRKTRRFLRN